MWALFSKIANIKAEYLNAGLPAAIIFDRVYSLMAKDGFSEVQQKLEAIALQLKNENDPDRRTGGSA